MNYKIIERNVAVNFFNKGYMKMETEFRRILSGIRYLTRSCTSQQ